LLFLAASYDPGAAEANYEAIKALYGEVAVTHDFDAAVLERDAEGKVRVVKKHEQPTRHGVAKDLGWGLAIGAATAIGLAGGLVAGGGAGAALGAVTGHVKGGMKDDDLKQLGEVLEKGEHGLLAVHATNMADQVATNIKAVNRFVSDEIDARATSSPGRSRLPRARTSSECGDTKGSRLEFLEPGPLGPVGRSRTAT
jgi:uncharacterized membrane protein